VLILITTDEPMTAFRPAIARPGRCGSLVGFERFGAEEASEWQSRTTTPAPQVAVPLTLAELHALKAGRNSRESSRTVGFRPRPAARIPGHGINPAAAEVGL
jgi:hypothetical protein